MDWDVLDENADLEGDYQTDMAYDGMGRPTTITLPQDVSGGRKLVTPSYNRSGAMESISLDGQQYVSRIAYNAKGQKVLMAYGNGLMTRHAYDAVNFRLLRQNTEAFSLSGLTYTATSGSTRQDCAYEYDLAGNITKMTDASPDAGVGGSGALGRVFEYDALYRLVMATGRESGQFSNSATPWDEGYYVPDNSANTTRHYTRSYEYDRLGNMLHLHHNAGVGNTFHRWFNDFNNNGTAFQASNLATEIAFGGTTVSYGFDACGNMVSEGSGRAFEWDFGDRMRGFSEGGVRAAYLYDGGGNRVKKVVRNQQGNSVVTVYIDGGFEYLYKLGSSGVVSEEHNELHVMDGRSRIAVNRIGSAFSGDASPAVRYNLEDHLGNAGFTVDSSGSLINREEYFAFGETSFGSCARKRYRFCGKERDEESGLYYYGARYYACWSCRFVSIDPLAGSMPFATPYSYAANNPVVLVDVDGLAPGGEDGGGPNGPSKDKGLLHPVDPDGCPITSIPEVSITGVCYDCVFRRAIEGYNAEGYFSNDPSKTGYRSTGNFQLTKQAVILTLDVIGMMEIPYLSPGADIISAILSATDGDWISAGFSLAATVPLEGDAATFAKWANKEGKLGNKAVEGGSKLGSQGLKSGASGGKVGGGRPRKTEYDDGPESPDPPEEDEKKQSAGLATVYWLKSNDQFGHFIVAVESNMGTTITHQQRLSKEDETKIVLINESTLQSKIAKAGLNGKATFELNTAGLARIYQFSQLGRLTGPYSEKTNSCLDHVCNVLRAGSVQVPFGYISQFKYLLGKMR